jgi:hypothetical protein
MNTVTIRCEAQSGRSIGQGAAVSAVGPGRRDVAVASADSADQQAAGVAVLHRRGADRDDQQQADGVDGDVAFAAVILSSLIL